MAVRTPVRLAHAPLAVAALVSSGCAIHMTHRCEVPPPVVEAAPGAARLPLAVAVRVVPKGTPSETFEQRDEVHRWGVDPVPPTRAMVARLAATAFERAILEPEGAASTTPGSDAILEVRVEELRFEWQPIGAGPYAARIAYRVALRPAEGAPVADLAIVGEGARGAVYAAVTHCKGIGDAVALAIQDAGAKLLAALSSDPAVLAWLATRGVPSRTFAVKPPESYPAPAPPPRPSRYDGPYVPPGTEQPGGPVGEAEPPAPARPVTAPPAKPAVPRSVQVRVAAGVFHHGDSTPGALEAPRTGFSFTILGMEMRPRDGLGLTFEFGSLARDYSAKALPPPSPFAVPQSIFLGTTLFGVGVRGVLPGGPVEPWIGATALALRNALSTTYTLFGFPGSGSPEEVAWSAGVDLGGGLLFYPGKGVQLGLEVRRIFSRASFDAFPGTVSIGGWTTSVSFGGAMP